MRHMFLIVLVTFLTGCSENPVDDSLLSGSWALAGDTCSDSSEKLLRFKDGNLVGNNFGVYEPFFKISYAKRKGQEVWIEFQPILARNRSDPVGIVFAEDGDKLIGQKTFNGRDFSGKKEIVRDLTWTRCSKASA